MTGIKYTDLRIDKVQLNDTSQSNVMTGIQYTDLPIDKVRQVAAAHIDTSSAQTDDDEDEEASTSDQADPMSHLQQPMDGLHLYVCCHGSRDSRCGKIGNRLAHRLDRLIQQRQLQEQVQVFKCSHVGGHKVLSSSSSSVELVSVADAGQT